MASRGRGKGAGKRTRSFYDLLSMSTVTGWNCRGSAVERDWGLSNEGGRPLNRRESRQGGIDMLFGVLAQNST